MDTFPYVITVSSEKGGVGKTTLATNLAIFLKALNEDLPVTIFSFDNHFTVDKMFSLGSNDGGGDVAGLLMETPSADLLRTGQYGVSYIPSSTELADLKQSIRSTMLLGRILANSRIPGIVIIDTRPDLDILTRNALFAADRVIIPVKDMPSLENCRNIFALFDQRGLDRKSLTLLPCLIDSRIKYEGPFRDQKSLLRAYAINRGYRCLDISISKSPKVESLNTNPAGKIFPILTHARGTDVHSQFAALGRMLLQEYSDCTEPRSLLFHRWMAEQDSRKKESYLARLNGIQAACPFCSRELLPSGQEPASHYYESSDGGSSGFLGKDCFHDFLQTTIYNLDKDLPADDPTRQIVAETARESAFVFRPVTEQGTTMVEFHRFDRSGLQIGRKRYPLRETTGGWLAKKPDPFHTLLTRTLEGNGGKLRDAFLLVSPTSDQGADLMLRDENYREFARLRERVAEQLS